MRVFLSILLAIIFLSVKGQTYHPFPTHDALWCEFYNDEYTNSYNVYHYFALKQENNDTLINGNIYHKLYHSFDTIFTEDKLCGGLREENKRIYFYALDSITISGEITSPSKKKEEILFDFSLQPGDTITTDSFRIIFSDSLKLYRIDSILVGNEYRREYIFGWIKENYELLNCNWIEGIGNKEGLLFPVGGFCGCNVSNQLICFREQNEFLFHSNQNMDCFRKSSIIEAKLKSKSKISVYPNPIISEAIIDFNNLSIDYLTVTNAYGSIVRSYKINGNSNFIFKKEDLSSGIYFFSFKGRYLEPQSIKVILE